MTAVEHSVNHAQSGFGKMSMTESNGASNSTSDLNHRNYIRWDDPRVEQIPEGEEEDVQAVVDMINKSQAAMYNHHRHCYGGTHARTQGLVKGEMIVNDNLPAHLKQSMFVKGGRYPIAMRYSSEPGDPALDDRIPQPRGLGMKVFNVQGDMFDEGVGIPTQDIEFNSTPALDLADAKTTKEIIGLRMQYADNDDKLHQCLQARKDAELQEGRYNVRNTHLESTRQYSQTAYRFGDYVAKYCLVPASETQKKLYEQTVNPNSHPDDVLSEWLKEFHADNEAEYLLQFQLCENLEDQPVEYAGKVWDAEKYPFQTVAKIVIPKQNSFKAARKTFWEDHLRLDPWHGLKSLQPLGSPNRLRRVVYPASSAYRRKMNGRKEVHITSIDQIPDGEWVPDIGVASTGT